MPDVAIHDGDEEPGVNTEPSTLGLYEAVVHLDATIDPRAKTI